MFRFVLVVFGAGLACGGLGLLLGMLGGFAWERFHRHRRTAHPPQPSAAPSFTVSSGGQARTTEARNAPLPSLRFDTTGMNAADYIALMRRVEDGAYDANRAAAALERTINIGAWDGTRLVGAARVLSDGYFTAALADLIVDPDFQRRGLGRELMNRAYAKTPRGSLTINAPHGTLAFFDRLGCERGPAGFVMRRAARPSA